MDEPSAESLFSELKHYVSFSKADEAAIRRFAPDARVHRDAIVDEFYDRILAHPGAAAAIRGGEAQVQRLKGALHRWMDELFNGPWDAAYFERRARIGRRHVQISLPQHYMFTAMSVIRAGLGDALFDSPRSTSEKREIMHAVNKLLDIDLAIMLHTYREHLVAKVVRSERLAAYGQVAASIAHELRNPLGVMDSSLYLLGRRDGLEPKDKRHIDRLRNQVDISNRIISDLLDLVRDAPTRKRPTPARTLVERALSEVAKDWSGQLDIDIDIDAAPLSVDPGQLVRVLINLLQNATEAAGDAGNVHLSFRVEGNSGVLIVSDDGPGVDPDIAARVFEPLVTTKAQGIGLGLSLCQRLVEENGGTIKLATGTLTGAAFEVRVPLDVDAPSS